MEHEVIFAHMEITISVLAPSFVRGESVPITVETADDDAVIPSWPLLVLGDCTNRPG